MPGWVRLPRRDREGTALGLADAGRAGVVLPAWRSAPAPDLIAPGASCWQLWDGGLACTAQAVWEHQRTGLSSQRGGRPDIGSRLTARSSVGGLGCFTGNMLARRWLTLILRECGSRRPDRSPA